MTALTLINQTIRQHERLYSLNDLHQAAGGEDRHQPALFIRLDSTQALVQELCSTDMQNINEAVNPTTKYLSTVRGRGKAHGGGAPAQQVRWYESVLPLIEPFIHQQEAA